VDGAGQAQLVGAAAVPGSGVLPHPAARPEVVVPASVLATGTRQVVRVAWPVDSGNLVDGHHLPQDKYPPKAGIP